MNDNIVDLTGNAEFQFLVTQAISSARQTSHHVALLFIEFDRNQDLMMGMESLRQSFMKEMLDRLRSTLRSSDTIVLAGNSRFAVLLPSLSTANDADFVAAKIRTRLEAPLGIEQGLILKAHARIGIALFPELGGNAVTLMQHADTALAAAIHTSNPCVTYSATGFAGKLSMIELRNAITKNQLFVVYQPKINLKNGNLAGVEALTRWRHPELGIIAPDEFIPVAERTGLIIPMTYWVLEQALCQCRAWQEIGFDVPVAVNLSMCNFEADDLPEQINELLQRTGVPPELLICEITETAIMGNPHRVLDTLRSIQNLGIRFAIDDFGVGYSSLSYLRKLPVAAIKIDKSFVRYIDSDKENAVIVRSIVDLGHNLGLKVTAEGIESPQAVEILKALNCDEGQGYYFGRPVVGNSITQYLETLAPSENQLFSIHDVGWNPTTKFPH